MLFPRGFLAVLPIVLACSPLLAQSDTARWVLVAPGKQYEAGGVRRFFFGSEYRDMWTTPTKVDVLSLQTYAGGLTPVKLGGGQQTKSLRFQAADGRLFNFRSVNKDPSVVLPPDLRGTFADDIVQDQISSAHPAGPLPVSHLLTAAGVIHARQAIFVMPDDPALGEFRQQFAGMLGLLEEHTGEGTTRTPGLEQASKIIDMDKLLEHLEERPSEHIDTLAYLKARLMDLLIGDWDRHRGQWRWARPGPDKPETAWVPVPEDRDQAFVRYDGLLLSIARKTRPQLVNFGTKYPTIFGATFNGRELDRQLLAAVDRPVWDSVARDLQRRITNQVIDSAARTLPVQHYRIDGPRLAATLKVRRDNLHLQADKWFEHLNTEADLHATDQDDRVTVTRSDRSVEVLMEGKDQIDGQPVVIRQASRTFRPAETNEIRLYLHGGDDTVRVVGSGSGGIKIRVIGGEGRDVVIDSSRTSSTRAYDTGKQTARVGRVSLNDKPYTRPDTTTKVPPRDWGSFYNPVGWGSYGTDIGLFLGGGIVRTGYGFRKHPYSTRYMLRGGYATTPKTFRAEFVGEWRKETSQTRFNLLARASGIEILRFYGFGNETSNAGGNNFHKVQQDQFLLEPSLTFHLASALTFTAAARAQFNRLDENNARFIATLPGLYGTGEFGQVGGRAAFRLDTRDVPAAARRGLLLNLEGMIYPAAWDVVTMFGKVRGDISTYLSASIPLRPTLALRVGGEKVFGDSIPFHEAAYVGGRSTLRGWQEQRFAGDAAVYGNAELRLRLGRIFLLVPTDLGVFGLADIGRVYLDGENSEEWHTGFGGGVSLGILSRASTLTITAARSDEQTGIYIRAGFLF